MRILQKMKERESFYQMNNNQITQSYTVKHTCNYSLGNTVYETNK